MGSLPARDTLRLLGNSDSHDDFGLAPGYRLDRYELLAPLAEGAATRVWVARQRGKHGFEKLVALKVILPRLAADPRFRAAFFDELRVASRLEHTNIARILDLGDERDLLYLAMEYVDGDSLSKLRRACQGRGLPIPAGVVLRIGAGVCAGLHEAHELTDSNGRSLDVVHRDVNPRNILLTAKGVPKLVDFGMAKARSQVLTEGSAGLLKAKVRYMAPEAALGRAFDRRADVWAVGATLYHCLAGRPPFEGESPVEMLHRLTSGVEPPPLPAAVPSPIAAVVHKAMMFRPELRFETAAAMGEAIERAMFDAQVPATTTDVVCFVAEHLGERIDKRARIVAIALAAAAERQRIEQLLEPTIERTGAGGSSNPPPLPPVEELPHVPMADPRPSTEPAMSLPAEERRTPAIVTDPPLERSAAATMPLRPLRARTWIAASLILLLAIALLALASRPSPKNDPPVPARPAATR